MINDLAVSCSLGNTKIRTIIFPYLQKIKFDSPAARLVYKYFLTRKADNQSAIPIAHPIELASFTSFLTSEPYVDKVDGEKKNLNFNDISKIVEIVKTYMNSPEDQIGEHIKTFNVYYKQQCYYAFLIIKH